MEEFLFPITCVVILTIAFVFSIIRGREGEAGAIFSAIFLIFFLILWLVNYVFSIGDVAEMKSFVDSNKSAYEYAIVSTQEVEIKAVSSTESAGYQVLDTGDLAYLKLGSQASERIKEFRAKVVWYNTTLERYKQLNEFWLTKGFYANMPKDILPIILK